MTRSRRPARGRAHPGVVPEPGTNRRCV